MPFKSTWESDLNSIAINKKPFALTAKASESQVYFLSYTVFCVLLHAHVCRVTPKHGSSSSDITYRECKLQFLDAQIRTCV